MPPINRPFPRFIADAPREGSPYGRWAERLAAEFSRACSEHVAEAGSSLDEESVRWFPERAWGGRVYLPATGRATEPATAEDGRPVAVEYFGWVSFERSEDGEPRALRAKADFTDVTADDNPDWQIDLNDDVIGSWYAGGERGGEITLVWGLPLVRGAAAATAELDGQVVDQAAVADGRFTLVAVDAVHGFADDLYLEVKLWDRRLREVATESLYEEPEEDGEDATPPASPGDRQ
ncbi:MAG TPA: hypothetical protein VK919_08955 [Solirubrobacterales bacterium]|nr:hypothetical protein [Solirubrobacterales bacterium]